MTEIPAFITEYAGESVAFFFNRQMAFFFMCYRNGEKSQQVGDVPTVFFCQAVIFTLLLLICHYCVFYKQGGMKKNSWCY